MQVQYIENEHKRKLYKKSLISSINSTEQRTAVLFRLSLLYSPVVYVPFNLGKSGITYSLKRKIQSQN